LRRFYGSNSHFKTLGLFQCGDFREFVDDGMRITAVLFLKTSIRSVGGASLYGESRVLIMRIAGFTEIGMVRLKRS
jgi:hypothetical protein